MPKTVAHLTSVHPRYDTRIFLKECQSLARAGYVVHLVVADGKGDEVCNGVAIHDVGVPHGRLQRMWRTTRRVYDRALGLDADIYHLHDPELIPIGLRLKGLGRAVIFDSHEDVPKQMLGKPYLNPVFLRVLAWAFDLYERYACPKFDAVVTATDGIGDKFQSINSSTVVVNNFPILDEMPVGSTNFLDRQKSICYVGGINFIRGIEQMVEALESTDDGVRLQLVGPFDNDGSEDRVRQAIGWTRVDALGYLNRYEVGSVMAQALVGLVVFHPLPNHVDAMPNKMFEYMSAGLPVIASHFPLWKDIIEGNDCGICVDPLSPADIATAINTLVEDPLRAQQMGANGCRAVREKYNWSIEQVKLLKLYSTICDRYVA